MKLVHYGPEGGKSTLEIPNPGSERKVAKIWFFGSSWAGRFWKGFVEKFCPGGVLREFCIKLYIPNKIRRAIFLAQQQKPIQMAMGRRQ